MNGTPRDRLERTDPAHVMFTPIPTNRAPLTAWSAAAATGGRIIRLRDDKAACGIACDSRGVTPEGAFVALRGQTHDGHDFLDSAVSAGARLIVVETGRTPHALAVDAVEVDDTLVAWGQLARAHVRGWRRERASGAVFAITGSAGKTTTKALCAALLRAVDTCHAGAGNLNNRIGVPAVAFGLEPQHRFAVFEVGMSVRGEIAELARVVEPDVAVITNVGLAHAAGVGGTRADVAREKGDLIAGLSERAAVVVPYDDLAAVGQLARTRASRAATFGKAAGADYRLVRRDLVHGDRDGFRTEGAELAIERRRDGSLLSVRFPLVGEVAALDLVASLAAVEIVTGPLTGEAVTAALAQHLCAPSRRMQVRWLASGAVILDDAYNANPDSVRAALKTLSELANGRRPVLVLGEMRELGMQADSEHSALGSAIAASGAKLAISCGGLAHLAVAAAEASGVRVALASNVDAAAELASNLVLPGDIVLVKASRGVCAERVVDALVRAAGGESPRPESRMR